MAFYETADGIRTMGSKHGRNSIFWNQKERLLGESQAEHWSRVFRFGKRKKTQKKVENLDSYKIWQMTWNFIYSQICHLAKKF